MKFTREEKEIISQVIAKYFSHYREIDVEDYQHLFKVFPHLNWHEVYSGITVGNTTISGTESPWHSRFAWHSLIEELFDFLKNDPNNFIDISWILGCLKELAIYARSFEF